MKMPSRLFALLMVVVLLVSLCACGSNDAAVTTTAIADVTTTVVDAATTTVLDSDPAETDTAATEATSVVPDSAPTEDNTTAATNPTTMNNTAAVIIGTKVTTTTGTDAWEGAVKVTTTTVVTTTTTAKPISKLNNVPLTSYTIVYGKNDLDYGRRAAEYIQQQIKERTGVSLTVCSDAEKAREHEIVVGETTRAISRTLNADTDGLEFAIMAQGNHVAMEGDYFIIAAAAYYFIQTYISDNGGSKQVPENVSVHTPIVKDPKNFMLLIGDGMGVQQTRLFEVMSAAEETEYSDNETLFYGYLFPAQGFSRTASLSGVTDSAAGGTALASGFKTLNDVVGKDENCKDVPSLTEIANGLGMASAVMSTEPPTGATPSAFSAHATTRSDESTIKIAQAKLTRRYGTRMYCDYDVYDKAGVGSVQSQLSQHLKALAQDPDGFFLMYEEAHIDKHCHNSDRLSTFRAMVRFNQAIGIFMEFAFYNPDTFVLITADHETGGLTEKDGTFRYTTPNHTGANVPVFAYGNGSELFNNVTVENIQIPKTIAAFWGEEISGTDNQNYPSLIAAK